MCQNSRTPFSLIGGGRSARNVDEDLTMAYLSTAIHGGVFRSEKEARREKGGDVVALGNSVATRQ